MLAGPEEDEAAGAGPGVRTDAALPRTCKVLPAECRLHSLPCLACSSFFIFQILESDEEELSNSKGETTHSSSTS